MVAVYLLLQTTKMWFRILLNLRTKQIRDIIGFEYIGVHDCRCIRLSKEANLKLKWASMKTAPKLQNIFQN